MMGRSIRQFFRDWQWLAVVLLFAMLSTSPAHAAVEEIHVVAAGVDHDSAAAYDKAVDYAKKRAIYLAARKMGVGDASAAVAKLSPDNLALIIRGADILQTRREQDITYAEVNVSIVVEALRRALKLPDAAEDTKSLNPAATHGVLLLSVYVTPERAYMWENENILRAPLVAEIQRQSHGLIMLPGGDFDDLRLIDYNNALKVKPEELKPMFERYGAKEIIIAVLTPGKPDTLEPTTILLRRLTLTSDRSELMQVTPTDIHQRVDSRVAKGAETIAGAVTQIATSTSEQDRETLAKATKIPVRFRYITPQELGTMQNAVRDAPHVLLLELPSIALNDIAGTIYLDGDKAELQQLLAKQGIIVTETKDGWQVSMR